MAAQLTAADRPDNQFERERLELIQKNREMLATLQVDGAKHQLVHAGRRTKVASACSGKGMPRAATRRRALPHAPARTRKSRRLRGKDAAGGGSLPGAEEQDAAASDGAGDEGSSGLMDQLTYLEHMGIAPGDIETDGRFRGWVSPEVCAEYGIAESAEAAWEENGGGKFTFKIDKKSVPSHLMAKGWSVARAHSFTMLKKNPNTYFYRNVRPGETHAAGEWSEEEHRIFLEVAAKHGVGDKWGLFASHLRHRVGYQCSGYYRDVIIPRGLVLDKRYKINRRGKAVFVG
eukprot:jgi/Tetstr1/434402/TSEL_023502.t1